MSKWQTYKEFLQRIPWAKHCRNLVRYAIVCLLIAAIWRTYEDPLLETFDKCILPVLEIFKANTWNKALTYFVSAILLYVILYRHIKHRYLYNPQLILVLGWFAVILEYYRRQYIYDYEVLYGRIAYVDVLIFFAGLTAIAAIVNYIVAIIAEIRLQKKELLRDGMLYDNPISTLDEDELDWSDEVEKLLGVIQQLQKSQPISISINARWGAGKTSFLKILQSSIDKTQYEVVYFNPRESKTASDIQEDFFQQIMSVLALYNGAAEYNLKKYMQALQVIDDKNWITKILNIYIVLNKESYRDKIKRICDKLPVKIIIIIDDFDRLLPDEILEVLKLINTNATFSNFIFLTAYDKTIVNDMLEKLGKTEESFFTDKYFDLEYSLPLRAYKYIQDYFVNNLCTALHLNEDDTERIKKLVEAHVEIFQDNLPTIRDAKRLINQILLDYHLVEGEVVLTDFMYVQLLKYKYPAEYKKLSNKSYVDIGYATIFLSEETIKSGTLKCLPILQILFKEKEEDYRTDTYRHVYSIDSFDSYFFNKLYGALQVRDMRKIFEMDLDDAQMMINEWIKDGYAEDLSSYLNSFYINTFSSKTQLLRYAATATYLAIRTSNVSGHTAFSRATYIPILNECLNKCQLSIEEYTKFIMAILTNRSIDPHLRYIYDLNLYYCNGIFDDGDNIIKRDSIWPIIKADFLENVNNDNLSDIDAQDFITRCIDHLDENKKSVLDVDCCLAYRKYLDRHPNLYIASFVSPIPDAMGNLNMIGCSYYYLQIFETNKNFISYVTSCGERGVPYSNQVLNFMRLYAANEYEPIDFRNHGDLRELLKTYDFSAEADMLDQLLSVERALTEIISDNDMTRNALRLELERLRQEVNGIDLHIALHDSLYKSLNDAINDY